MRHAMSFAIAAEIREWQQRQEDGADDAILNLEGRRKEAELL